MKFTGQKKMFWTFIIHKEVHHIKVALTLENIHYIKSIQSYFFLIFKNSRYLAAFKLTASFLTENHNYMRVKQ